MNATLDDLAIKDPLDGSPDFLHDQEDDDDEGDDDADQGDGGDQDCKARKRSVSQGLPRRLRIKKMNLRES